MPFALYHFRKESLCRFRSLLVELPPPLSPTRRKLVSVERRDTDLVNRRTRDRYLRILGPTWAADATDVARLDFP